MHSTVSKLTELTVFCVHFLGFETFPSRGSGKAHETGGPKNLIYLAKQKLTRFIELLAGAMDAVNNF